RKLLSKRTAYKKQVKIGMDKQEASKRIIAVDQGTEAARDAGRIEEPAVVPRGFEENVRAARLYEEF
ncbi:hypothetical protein BOX15_Mlig025395g2, partial [Macrostomum lignano]